jgi:DNA-binding transcriptional LysR family regulator
MISHLPEIELKVEISDSLKVFQRVQKGDYEIGIIGTHFDATDVDFTVFVKDDRLVLIIPKKHSLAAKETISLGDLKGQSFITREKGSGTRAVYEKVLNDAGFALTDLNTVAEVGSTEGVVQAVSGGVGIGIVSELAARDAIELGKVKALNIPLLKMIRDFSIITRKGRPLSRDASKVISVIKVMMTL